MRPICWIVSGLLLEEGKGEAQLKLLQAHRGTLLKKLHDAQKHLDRLDYFIYETRKTLG